MVDTCAAALTFCNANTYFILNASAQHRTRLQFYLIYLLCQQLRYCRGVALPEQVPRAGELF